MCASLQSSAFGLLYARLSFWLKWGLKKPAKNVVAQTQYKQYL